MSQKIFSGNIIIFHAFDVGEEVNLERIKLERMIGLRPSMPSKYFKNYHIPLAVEPLHGAGNHVTSAKLHNFGVITLRYQIPFNSSLEDLKKEINNIERLYHVQSVADADAIFKQVRVAIKQARFFQIRKSYVMIQVNPEPGRTDVLTFKEEYGNIIASTLRFETETLSEYQKNEILMSAFGYYRGDLIIIDTEAAFVYDDEYDEILDLFEFANMQQLELQYFDRVLDTQLNTVYEREVKAPPFRAYLPFIGATNSDPIGDLDKLKVDISVITERLESSIKLSGEAYYTELYALLMEKLDLANWKDGIHRKLSIIQDIATVYQNKIDAVRGDILTVTVIVLVFLEFVIGFLNLMRH